VGVGLPLSTGDSSLPFFKQYYSGGVNSMRGWPVRGIGPGAKPLAPYNANTLNDRTGDIKLEANGEFRYNIAQNIFNTFNLKGVLFVDAGNVWNFRNTRPGGGDDSLQFNINHLYQQLGVAAGTGFRIDVANIVIRIDLGFRFKHPDILANDGWKAPSIGFDDLFPKLFSREYRQWRYENFNLNIGIGLPFQ
jgi:outer membrane protein assembly factor BamA